MCQHNSNVIETLKVMSDFFILVYNPSLIIIMDLSTRIVHVRSTLKPDVKEYPAFIPDDTGLLFGDIASPTGLILNHNYPRECYVIFPDSEYVLDILKLSEDPQWVGTHMHLTLDRPKKEIISIVAKLLEDKALEEFEYIPIEADGSPQFLSPKRERFLPFHN